MITKQKVTGTASSIPAGIGLGLLISMAVTVSAAALLAWLMVGEKLEGESLGFSIMAMVVLASFAGALTAASRIKRLRVQMCLVSGGVYYLSLLAITALLFGGKYQGMGVTALTVLGGTVAAAAIGLVGQNKGKSKFRKKGYR